MAANGTGPAIRDAVRSAAGGDGDILLASKQPSSHGPWEGVEENLDAAAYGHITFGAVGAGRGLTTTRPMSARSERARAVRRAAG